MTLLTLVDILAVIDDRSQEFGLSANTTAEKVRYLDRATLDIRKKWDADEVRSTTDLSFTRSTTLPYATVAAPSDWWAPIYFNNATDDYKFWWTEPNVIRNQNSGSFIGGGAGRTTRRKDIYLDVYQAFSKEGSNLLIYHDVTETLTLKYYSKFLIATVTSGTPKETWASNGTDLDTFILEDDDMLISRTLMYLAQKEPGMIDQYAIFKTEFDDSLKANKLQNPSQRPERLEQLEFIG